MLLLLFGGSGLSLAAGSASASGTLTMAQYLPLGAGSASASGTLTSEIAYEATLPLLFSAPPVAGMMTMQAGSATASGTLALGLGPQFNLGASAAQATGTLASVGLYPGTALPLLLSGPPPVAGALALGDGRAAASGALTIADLHLTGSATAIGRLQARGSYGARGLNAAHTVMASTGSGDHNGFPVIAKLSNGDLFAAWRNATSHAGTVQSIGTSYSTDNGVTWSSEVAVVAGIPTCPQGLTQLADGRVALTTSDRNPNLLATVRYAANAAAAQAGTWGAPQTITTGFGGDAYIAAPIVELSNGDLVVPVCGVDAGLIEDGYIYTRVSRSTDDGVTWTDYSTPFPRFDYFTGDGFEEPTLVQLQTGELFCAARVEEPAESTGSALKYAIWGNWSTDNGATWGTPLKLFANFSERAACWQAPEGDVFILSRTVLESGQQFLTEQVLHQSWDNGRTWGGPITVETNSYTGVYGGFCTITAAGGNGAVGLVYGREYNGATQADVIFKTLTAPSASPALSGVQSRGTATGSLTATIGGTLPALGSLAGSAAGAGSLALTTAKQFSLTGSATAGGSLTLIVARGPRTFHTTTARLFDTTTTAALADQTTTGDIMDFSVAPT